MEIAKVFNPTPSRVISSRDNYYSFYRLGEWTGTPHWLIRTELEPVFLNKLKEGERKPEKKTIKEIVKQKPEKGVAMEIKNHFILDNNIPYVLLRNGKQKTFVNAYFLAMFEKCQGSYNFYYWQEKGKPLLPIYITRGNNIGSQLVGVVMPSKLS